MNEQNRQNIIFNIERARQHSIHSYSLAEGAFIALGNEKLAERMQEFRVNTHNYYEVMLKNAEGTIEVSDE